MTTLPVSAGARGEMADCWNRIGVAGDQSCPKLKTYIHCRNCEVYAEAAQRNLQRPVDAAYRSDWAAHFRRPESAGASHDSAALAFRIGREWLALPAAMVLSVAPQAPGHRLPHRGGKGLTGIVNVGGKLLPSIALATLIGIDEQDAPLVQGRHVFPRLVVAEYGAQAFALPVADLHGIVRYARADLAPAPATVNKGLVRYLSGVLVREAMVIGVLDAELLGHQMTRLLR